MVSGIIKDATNGETIYGATVYLKGTTIGTLSNEYGFYSNRNDTKRITRRRTNSWPEMA